MTDTTDSRRILMLLTSHDDLGGKRKTGFFASEAAEAWLVFTQAGYEVDTVTVQPGRPPIDGLDEDDETQQRFFAAVDLDTLPSLADLDPAQLNGYDAVFLPGGHGTVWDFPAPKSVRLCPMSGRAAAPLARSATAPPGWLLPWTRTAPRSCPAAA